MATGTLSISLSGIQAAQLGLQVTQHNIANANTPGYSLQSILQSAKTPVLTGSGYLGTGASVDGVRRAYDTFLTQQTNAAQSKVSESETLLSNLTRLDNMFGDASTGLAPAMQDFFTGVQQVSSNPSLISARQVMLSSSQVLTGRFNSLYTQINEAYDSVNNAIITEVASINSYTQQIADVSTQIMLAEGATNNPANDLSDLRDRLVAELNKHVRVSTVQDSSGNFNVFMSNGQQLVVGGFVNQLTPLTSSTDANRLGVGMKGPSGTTLELQDNLIEGGALGGLMKFRTDSLDVAADSLGSVAAALALTFNAQHALGQDLEGLNAQSVTGGFQADFFSLPRPAVFPSAGGAATVTVDFTTTYDATKGNFVANKWPAGDYVLNNDGVNITLTRVLDGQTSTWTAGSMAALNAQISSEGLSLGGAVPTAGVDYDFSIEKVRSVARDISINPAIAADNRRIAAAAPTTTSLGLGNLGTLRASQGSVSPGYSLANLNSATTPPEPTFTYDLASDQFSYTGSGSVEVVYGSGAPQVAGALIDRVSGGVEISRIIYDGISVDLSGLPKDNDTFSILSNPSGVSDSRNAIKLTALQLQNTMAGGSSTYQISYAGMVSKIGVDTHEVKINGQAQQSLLKQNQEAIAALSGVNLDEEAANLIKYQQAYQASARAFDIASKLFDTLLGIVS